MFIDGLLNEGLKAIVEQSVLGALLVWFLIQNSKLVKQLFTIIEQNTAALTEMKSLVKKSSKE